MTPRDILEAAQEMISRELNKLSHLYEFTPVEVTEYFPEGDYGKGSRRIGIVIEVKPRK